MGKGLVEATLATFQGRTWKVKVYLDTSEGVQWEHRPLTGEQVIEVYRALSAKRTGRDWREPWAVVGDTSWSGPMIGRATQILRRAKLIRYENSLWRAVE